MGYLNFLVAVFAGHGIVLGQEVLNHLTGIEVNRMIRDVADLSSPKYRGRQAGTQGHDSARFVAKRFEGLGLIPPSGTNHLASNRAHFQTGAVGIPKVSACPNLEFTFLDEEKIFL